MKFRFYEILHWGPPLEVVWGLPLEIMRGPSLEGQSAAKCHAWVKVPRTAQSATLQDTYFIEKKYESLKVIEKDFDKFVLQYFQKIMAFHPLHYV